MFDPDNDAAHTDAPMFSCGSLAPKLKRGGGCMDHGFQRHTEPWEHTDGCIYLAREISKIPVVSSGTTVTVGLDGTYTTVTKELKEKVMKIVCDRME